jgi:putative phosphoribosyl transferase
MLLEIMKTVFDTRKEAAEQLAIKLDRYKDMNALVLGVPMGGIETAYHLAKNLNAKFSVIVAMKLPFPGYEEYGFGALCEEDLVYLAHIPTAISVEFLTELVSVKKMEIDKQVKKLRNNRPLPRMHKRVVIIVQDGISNGVTLVPLIRLSKRRKASKTIIASPVGCKEFDQGLNEADEIIVLKRPPDFSSAEECYQQKTSEEDILSLIENIKSDEHH